MPQRRTLRKARKWRISEMVADRQSETKKKRYFTKPCMFSGIFTILQVSRNAVYS